MKKKKLMDFLIPVDKNNRILLSHCINIMTDTACTMNYIFPKKKPSKLSKEIHFRNTEKDSQNNIA